MTRARTDRHSGKVNPKAWALKCKSCAQYSLYSLFDQKPLAHAGRVVRQAARARCPKCGAEHHYVAEDMELIAAERVK